MRCAPPSTPRLPRDVWPRVRGFLGESDARATRALVLLLCVSHANRMLLYRHTFERRLRRDMTETLRDALAERFGPFQKWFGPTEDDWPYVSQPYDRSARLLHARYGDEPSRPDASSRRARSWTDVAKAHSDARCHLSECTCRSFVNRAIPAHSPRFAHQFLNAAFESHSRECATCAFLVPTLRAALDELVSCDRGARGMCARAFRNKSVFEVVMVLNDSWRRRLMFKNDDANAPDAMFGRAIVDGIASTFTEAWAPVVVLWWRDALVRDARTVIASALDAALARAKNRALIARNVFQKMWERDGPSASAAADELACIV